MTDIQAVLRALRTATATITETEMTGYDTCRYCGAEDYPVDADGKRIDGEEEEATEYHCDHNSACPVYVINHAFDGLDAAMVSRVLDALHTI